jgi:hypothetical protein
MTAAGNEPLRSESHLTGWLKHGLIGGIVAGIVFAAFEMVIAAILDGPSGFFMPLRMIGGIAIGQQALDPGTSLLAAGSAGLVVHVLSAAYGIAIAGVARYVPALVSSATILIVWTSLAGFGLWLVNFYVIARSAAGPGSRRARTRWCSSWRTRSSTGQCWACT